MGYGVGLYVGRNDTDGLSVGFKVGSTVGSGVGSGEGKADLEDN